MADGKKDALARRQETAPAVLDDAAAVTHRLAEAASSCHLVAPATSVAALPDGCEVAVSTFTVDTNPKNGEVFDVGGKLALAKPALDKIGAAAGISWDSNRSRRLDDGRDPYYCSWVAVGTYRRFDGTPLEVQGTKEMDLREGSAQIEALWERFHTGMAAFKAGKRPHAPKDPTGQIREMRLHIVAHAETKARLRAIRAIGIKSSYNPPELKKPFVVASLMFTGRTDDPQLRAEAFRMRAHAMIGAGAGMFGGAAPAQAPAPLPPAAAPMALPPASPPPPLRRELDDDDVHPDVVDAPSDEAPPTPRNDRPRDDVARVPFGKNKDKPLSELSDASLRWYVNAMRESVEDPEKERFRAANEAHLAMFEAEQARRNGADNDPAPPGREPGDDDLF